MTRWLLCCLALWRLCACEGHAQAAQPGAIAAALAPVAALEIERDICRRRIAEARAQPDLGGAPAFDQARIAFLGRAHGEPVVFVSEPPPLDVVEPGDHPMLRIARVLQKPYARSARRKRLLRGGYLYADDPDEAFELVKQSSLPLLFDEEQLWLLRGETLHRLVRVKSRAEPYFSYEHADGPWAGQPAVLLFADRVAAEPAALEPPLHRDVRSLRERLGFERMRILHRGADALVAELRFGERWLEALLTSRGARLELGCWAASRADREAAEQTVAARAARERALAALRRSIDALVAERLPFDRPHEAEDHLSDGQLRPTWEDAYRKGKHGFGVDGDGYAVFDRQGRPYPPQTCVAMVLDAYERAAGTWYAPLGQPPRRIIGRLDFDAYDIDNRAGVLGFEKFAERHAELFTHRRIPDDERIPFRDRRRFFDYLAKHAAIFQPGDIVAIQGLKRDGNIHQHAILIDDVDPLTGFASGLVDQMTRPRRRTWEDIMAEAPARALLYHLQPTMQLLGQLIDGDTQTAVQEHEAER